MPSGMIISLKFENFRSYRDKAEFSFEALDSEYNSGSFTEVTLNDGSKLCILHSAVIFGANASGKSNVIIALDALVSTVAYSRDYTQDVTPDFIQPYAFDRKYLKRNTKIELCFVFEGKRYCYLVAGHSGKINRETLKVSYHGRNLVVFDRKEDISISTGKGWEAKDSIIKDSSLLSNQLFLSLLATRDAAGLQKVANYVGSLSVFNRTMHSGSMADRQEVMGSIIKDTKSTIFKKLENLLKIADLGVDRIRARRNDDKDFKLPAGIDESYRSAIIARNRWTISLGHRTSKPNEICVLNFAMESEGTKALFGVGARLLSALEAGSFVAYDEISDAIHPALLRLIVSLFHSKKSNPYGAQLLFSTHDASVADYNTLRSDQVWFVEKNESVSDLFSAQDFSDVDIQVPFEQWYRSGRFGALPALGDIEDIFKI